MDPEQCNNAYGGPEMFTAFLLIYVPARMVIARSSAGKECSCLETGDDNSKKKY
jgi:hypothetical protein